MQSVFPCYLISPPDGASAQPANLTLRWSRTGVTYSLAFGTKKDYLPIISNQSSDTYSLKNLDLNTIYYWQITATNSCKHTRTTEISSFTTIPDTNLPYVVTAPVFTHLNTPPRVGGNVLNEGSSELSDRGFYLGLSHNPEIGGTKFQFETGSGIFSDLIPGLNTNATYYVKAFATNNSGTAFGSEVSFITGAASDYKFIKDIEGNIYYTIIIGNQVWMAENLRTTRYNDGTLIPYFANNSVLWYCWYNNNVGFKSTYGALYNWYIVDPAINGSKNVCPAGWHVPSDSEWTTLTGYLGISAGTKLKERGDFYWDHSTTMGDNSTDFSALAGGIRYYYSYQGSFVESGSETSWWSTTPAVNYGMAISREVRSHDTRVYKEENLNSDGLYVRCIKDSK
jgi:uncharacterized protein (TIGR02145 family)